MVTVYALLGCSTSRRVPGCRYDGSAQVAEGDSFEFLPEAHDPLGGVASYAILKGPGNGTLYEVDALAGDVVRCDFAVPWTPVYSLSRYRYAPDPGFSAKDSIEFVAVSTTRTNCTSSAATFFFDVLAVDDLPTATAYAGALEQGGNATFALPTDDADTAHHTLVISSLPEHGTLYAVDLGDGALEAVAEYGASSSDSDRTSVDQYASSVLAVSTFWPASTTEYNGYTSWHPLMVLGEKDAPDAWGDSALAWSPLTAAGTRGRTTRTGGLR